MPFISEKEKYKIQKKRRHYLQKFKKKVVYLQVICAPTFKFFKKLIDSGHIQVVIILIIFLLHLLCLITEVDNWPLTSYPMYSRYVHKEDISSYKVYGLRSDNGHYEEIGHPFILKRRFSYNIIRYYQNNNFKDMKNEINNLQRTLFLSGFSCLKIVKFFSYPLKKDIIYEQCK